MYKNFNEILSKKATLPDNYKACKSLIRPLSRVYGAWQRAQRKFDENPTNIKWADRAEDTKQDFDLAIKDAFKQYDNYKNTVSRIEEGYEETINKETRRQSKRRLERDLLKFRISQAKLVGNLDMLYAPYFEFRPSEEEEALSSVPAKPNTEREISDEKEPPRVYTHPVYREPQSNTYQQHQSMGQNITIAPVSIDISPIVADALKSAVDIFKNAFDARVNKYLDTLPTPERDTEWWNREIARMSDVVADKIAEKEAVVLEKLTDLISEIDSLKNRISELEISKHILIYHEEATEEGAAEPIEEAPAEEIAEPIEEAPTEVVAEPIEEAPAEEIVEPIEEASAEEMVEPIKEAPTEVVAESIEEAPTEEIAELIEEAPAEEVTESKV